MALRCALRFSARLVAELGAEPHTPLDVAVRATLTGLGCLPAGADAAPGQSERTPGMKPGAFGTFSC